MVTWTTRKSRRAPETKKCSVRADCRPPSALTAAGTAESKPGDRARPVQITDDLLGVESVRKGDEIVYVRIAAPIMSASETRVLAGPVRKARLDSGDFKAGIGIRGHLR
jgi:hypothetical protein